MLRYIFSLVFTGACLFVFSQEEEVTSSLDKSQRFLPHELKVGLNAIRSGRTFLGSGVTTQELELALAVQQYILVANIGYEENIRGEEYDYRNRGAFYRVGFDRNFTKDKASGNALTLGLRYASAAFRDELAFMTDQGFGEQTYFLENDNLTARWFEVVFGIRGKIVSNFYIGFSMRWQTFRSVSGEGELKTFDIPGFGKTRRQNSTAFDYYLMWRIPFDK